MNVIEVAISAVAPNPDQPRKLFSQDALEELAESIRISGLLQPITVRSSGPDTYSIIAGERRWRASKIAGCATITANVIEADDRETFILALMENTARADMNPMEEARGYKRGIAYGFTAKEIEERAGVALGMVEWRLQLLGCIESVQRLVERGQLAPTFAAFMSKLGPNGQQKAIREYQKRKMTMTEFRVIVNALYAEENALDMFPETRVSPASVEAAAAFRVALRKIAEGAAVIAAMDKDALAPVLQAEADKLDREIAGVIAQLNGTSRFMQRLRGRGVVQDLLSVGEPASPVASQG